ncbi:MAG: peptidoglycan-binding domain-containing protein [Pseudomonadota bacterium]
MSNGGGGMAVVVKSHTVLAVLLGMSQVALAEPFAPLEAEYPGDGVQVQQTATVEGCEIIVTESHMAAGASAPRYVERSTIALEKVALVDAGGRSDAVIIDAAAGQSFDVRYAPRGAGSGEEAPWRLVLRAGDGRADAAQSAIAASAETCGAELSPVDDARALERLIEADIAYSGGRGGEENRTVTVRFALSEDGRIDGAFRLVAPKFRRSYAEENHIAALKSALEVASAEGRFENYSNYPRYYASLQEGFVGLRPDGEPRQPEVVTGSNAVAAGQTEDAISLSYGERRDIQFYLNSIGLEAGRLDGVFGLRTREAIAVWQKAAGEPATGYLNQVQAKAILDDPAANAPPPIRRQVRPVQQAAVTEPAAGASTAESGEAEDGNIVTNFANRVGPALSQARRELSDLFGVESADR